MLLLQFFILHFSFFIEFCEAKFRWASRFAGAACLRFAPHLLARSRRAIRSITRAASGAGGSATIPLAWARKSSLIKTIYIAKIQQNKWLNKFFG
jgi:hypothetical protein